MADEPTPQPSPKWSSLTKTVVGITIFVIFGALIIWLRPIIGPLILTFVLAYLLYPLVTRVSESLKVSWRSSVNLIYLVLVIIVVGLLTLSGLAVVQQVQSLVIFIQRFIAELPALIADLSTQVYEFGPWTINLGELLDVQAIANEVLATVQPLLGQAASIIGSFAGSAAVFFSWGLFVLLISYFLLAEAGKLPGQSITVEIPDYEYDIQRLGHELRVIWNAFLRGQLIIILIVVIVYAILLNLLGLRFAFGIAIMTGLARLIPYIGPLITLLVTALVAFFQLDNHFGLPPAYYAALVVVIMILVDQVFDNYISPRIFGVSLNVNPAAILIAAIIFANLIGVIGLVLAAPVVATLNLTSRYILRKMFDLDPWPEHDTLPEPRGMSWGRGLLRMRYWFEDQYKKYRK
jgi:predicted PurR-regulated permease PerM